MAAATQIKMDLFIKVPPSTGNSPPITVTTFTDTTKATKIDEDSTNVIIAIPSQGSAISNTYTLSNSIASGVGTTDLSFILQASVAIPINHKFEITFESSLTLAGGGTC